MNVSNWFDEIQQCAAGQDGSRWHRDAAIRSLATLVYDSVGLAVRAGPASVVPNDLLRGIGLVRENQAELGFEWSPRYFDELVLERVTMNIGEPLDLNSAQPSFYGR